MWKQKFISEYGGAKNYNHTFKQAIIHLCNRLQLCDNFYKRIKLAIQLHHIAYVKRAFVTRTNQTDCPLYSNREIEKFICTCLKSSSFECLKFLLQYVPWNYLKKEDLMFSLGTNIIFQSSNLQCLFINLLKPLNMDL